jgi:hypothetical protein
MGDNDATFNVGDVVLAKVKGYSAWPGMVSNGRVWDEQWLTDRGIIDYDREIDSACCDESEA